MIMIMIVIIKNNDNNNNVYQFVYIYNVIKRVCLFHVVKLMNPATFLDVHPTELLVNFSGVYHYV
jgi:hypothetical protein